MASVALNSSGKLTSAAVGTWSCLWTSAVLSLKAFRAAPFLLALVIVPEFAQHVAEISLGMFDSREAAMAVANHPLRWAFGFAKIAGLVAAMLLTARFWATGSVRAALRMPLPDLGRLLIALALLFGSGAALEWLGSASGVPLIKGVVTAITWLSQAMLMVMVAGALLGDREGWRSNLVARIPTALLMLLVAAALFVPLQLLHGANHSWAFGQPAAVVWGLMLFDSLVVGLLASAVGAALFVTYRAGPTRDGWTRDPRW
ncbi:hypothetical protein [Sphingomonas sp. LHG3443-2]|uniref:hypothetical protein n=1 Tax=Sphingomonas sp. LHG3443-2 TaxID=2804639 RepID=UPI003CEF74B0